MFTCIPLNGLDVHALMGVVITLSHVLRYHVANALVVQLGG